MAGPSGGPQPIHQEIVFRGPFPGPNRNLSPYFVRNPNQRPADAINVDNLFGELRTRGDIRQLLLFAEPDGATVPAWHVKRDFQGYKAGVPLARFSKDKSLAWLEVSSAVSPVDVDGSTPSEIYGVDPTHAGLADLTAVGHWFYIDSLYRDKFSVPPVGAWPAGEWNFPRYKVGYFGGQLLFIHGSPFVSVMVLTGFQYDAARLIGGFITAAVENPLHSYQDLVRISNVVYEDPAIFSNGTLILDRDWPGPTILSFEYLVYFPIIDANDTKTSPPFYRNGSDYCEIPLSEGGIIPQDKLNLVDNVAPVGLVPEYGEFFVNPVFLEFLYEGQSLRFPGTITAPRETIASQINHGIFHIKPTPEPPGPNAGDHRVLFWPPPTFTSASEPFQSIGRTAYFVTGAAGSTVVMPGAIGVMAQDAGDAAAFVANCCEVYANRTIIGTDKSWARQIVFSPPTSPQFTKNTTDPDIHPGRIAWTRNGRFTTFTGPGSGSADLDIGPILWMFVMRDTLFLTSETGIVSGTRTDNPNFPIRFRTLIKGKKFVSWAKPKVIDGSVAAMLTPDDVVLFDGSAFRKITGDIKETYRRFVANAYPREFPNHLHYDQGRNRLWITPGVSQTVKAIPFNSLTGEINEGEWFKFALPDSTGGGTDWQTTRVYPGGIDGLDTELLLHTTGITQHASVTPATKDRIMSLQHGDRGDESADSLGETLIPWTTTTGWFDMESPRDEKTITRVRVVYVADTDLLITTNDVNIKITEDNGTFVAGILNLSGDNGTIKTADFTTRLTAYQFKVTLSQPAGVAVPDTPIPRILEIGVVYEQRQERRPL